MAPVQSPEARPLAGRSGPPACPLRCWFVSLVLSGLAVPSAAQVKLDPASSEGRQAIAAFESIWEGKGRALACRVQPVPPRMAFSFRLWAGYQIWVSMSDFPPEPTRIGILFRVRPLAKSGPGAPVFFWDVAQLPEASRRPRGMASWGGGFYLGAGEYQVDWLAGDAQGRHCRSSWKLKGRGKASQMALQPGQLDAVGVESWRGRAPGAAKNGPRVTIFLHAAPRRPGRSQLSGYDRMLLLSSLTALLDLSGFASARLVAFDGNAQKVLFRAENFDQNSYARLAEIIRQHSYGAVDYQVLRNGVAGEGKFLAGLIDEDRQAPRPSDRLVFLGPELRSARKLPEPLLALAPTLPPTYYLALARDVVPQGDLIAKLVKAAKGKTYLVLRNTDLLKPIREVAQGKGP